MWIAQTAPFRYVAAPGKCGATPPPACGAACARVRKSRFEFDLTEKRTLPTGGVQNALFRDPNLPECAFPSRRDRRMRFSVRVPAQNAPFRRVRFFSPGQTSSHLTEKRTLPQRLTEKRTLPQRLTEKRTLVPAPHAQAHSAARSGPPPTPADPPHHGSGVCAVAQVVSLSDSVAYGVVAKFGTKLLSQRVDVHPHRIAEQIYVAVPGVGEQLLAADRSPAVT